MGYAAVKGGLDAIHAAEALVRRARLEGEADRLGLDGVVARLRLLVDRVMGEGGLWAPELAARAIRQAEGDVVEAVQLLRSHRSTLPRLGTTLSTHADELEVVRRVVPAYRTPPGPQLLGRTLDYTGRLLDFRPEELVPSPQQAGPAPDGPPDELPGPLPRLLDLLRKRDLVVDRRRADDPEPFDLTRSPLRVPAPRSARLAALARAETGALVNLWYQGVRGPKAHLHEVTLGEVRHGRLPIRVAHPRTGRPVDVGTYEATEVEAYEDVHSTDDDRFRFDVGYGLVLGHNERKAIAMSVLDVGIERDRGRSSLEQAVLQTCDGTEATGFLEHLKLPHYVTFRSQVERKEAQRRAEATRTDHRPTHVVVTQSAPTAAPVEADAR